MLLTVEQKAQMNGWILRIEPAARKKKQKREWAEVYFKDGLMRDWNNDIVCSLDDMTYSNPAFSYRSDVTSKEFLMEFSRQVILSGYWRNTFPGIDFLNTVHRNKKDNTKLFVTVIDGAYNEIFNDMVGELEEII